MEKVKVNNPDSSSIDLAMMENFRLMAQIVAEMKEVAILPSEIPQDKSTLEQVEFPEEGGVLTYMAGHKHPFRGFPYFEFVDSIDKIKKIGKAQLSGLYHTLFKGNKLKLLSLLPAIWIFKRLVYTEIYMFHRLVDRFKLKENRYCRAVRELNRCFNLPMDDISEKTWELKLMIKDLTAMLLEFDNAYRFRFQDIMEELDQDNMRRKPFLELRRLIALASQREKSQELRDFWSLVSMLLNYLHFDRELKKVMVNVLSNLDKEKVKLTIEDKEYCIPRKDYNFGFVQRGELE